MRSDRSRKSRMSNIDTDIYRISGRPNRTSSPKEDIAPTARRSLVCILQVNNGNIGLACASHPMPTRKKMWFYRTPLFAPLAGSWHPRGARSAFWVYYTAYYLRCTSCTAFSTRQYIGYIPRTYVRMYVYLQYMLQC